MNSVSFSIVSKLVYMIAAYMQLVACILLRAFHLLSTTAHRLFSILLLCTVGRTTAHTSACTDVTVIVTKWEDFIQNGVSISLFAGENYLTNTVIPKEKINIRITPDCCAIRANLVESSNTTLTIKNDAGGQLFSDHIPWPEGKTSVGWSFRYYTSLILLIANTNQSTLTDHSD